LAILVALDSLGGLGGNDSTDCGGAVGDGGGGSRAEAVNDSWKQERYEDDEEESDGEERRWNCHLKEVDSCFFFFIERERERS
jgi:hypothetical protein